MCGLCVERFQLGPLILSVESMPIYYQKLDLELKFKLNKIQGGECILMDILPRQIF